MKRTDFMLVAEFAKTDYLNGGERKFDMIDFHKKCGANAIYLACEKTATRIKSEVGVSIDPKRGLQNRTYKVYNVDFRLSDGFSLYGGEKCVMLEVRFSTRCIATRLFIDRLEEAIREELRAYEYSFMFQLIRQIKKN